VGLQLSRKLEFFRDFCCSYEVPAEDSAGGSTRLSRKHDYCRENATKVEFPIVYFLQQRHRIASNVLHTLVPWNLFLHIQTKRILL